MENNFLYAHLFDVFQSGSRGEKGETEAAVWMSHVEKKEEEKKSIKASGEESPSLLTLVGSI